MNVTRAISTIILLIIIATVAFAQGVPDGIAYQTKVRQIEGRSMKGKDLFLRIELHSAYGTENAQLVYREDHSTTSGPDGLVSFIIGEGEPSFGSFKDIPWEKGNIWVLVQSKQVPGSSFRTVSVSPFMAVPYAQHSATTEKLMPGDLSGTETSRIFSYTWNTTGNFNMDPNYFFLGNLDDRDLVFRSGYLERMRILAGGDVWVMQSLHAMKSLNIQGELSVMNNGILLDSFAVLGNATFMNDVTLGGLKANALISISRDTTDHVAYFTNLNENDGDGIAIKINVDKNYSENKYIKLFDGTDKLTGSVEGFDIDRDQIDIPVPSNEAIAEAFCAAIRNENPLYAALVPFSTNLNSYGDLWDLAAIPGVPVPDIPDLSIPGFTLLPGFCAIPNPSPFGPSCFLYIPTINFPSTGIMDALTLPDVPSYNFSDQIGAFPSLPVIGSGNCPSGNLQAYLDTMKIWVVENEADGFLTTDPGDLILAAVLWQLAREANDGGVSYSSNGADYAEWLEKSDPDQKFMFGQIVGVKGGKISLNTSGAEQIMSISRNPVVIGNMPDKKHIKNYARVAFMGQVPVFVKGGCQAGDFIVPSGNNDGMARAIAPDKITIQHVDQIAGRAIEGSENPAVDMVMMMVGVKTNEWQYLFNQQETRIQSLENKVDRIRRLSEMIDSINQYSENKSNVSSHAGALTE